MKMPFSIVVAVDANLGIGQDNALPWHLPGDLRHFKTVTTQGSTDERKNVVIMGRRTWDSIPEKFRPLPGRINCVLSRDSSLSWPQGVLSAQDFDGALAQISEYSRHRNIGEIFVIGGGEVFKTALDHPFCQKLYLTHIQHSFSCDRFFPSIPPLYKEVSRSIVFEEAGFSYFFCEYLRK